MIDKYTVDTHHNIVYYTNDKETCVLLNNTEVFKADDIRKLLNDRIYDLDVIDGGFDAVKIANELKTILKQLGD